jgi:hypothetical protein
VPSVGRASAALISKSLSPVMPGFIAFARATPPFEPKISIAAGALVGILDAAELGDEVLERSARSSFVTAVLSAFGISRRRGPTPLEQVEQPDAVVDVRLSAFSCGAIWASAASSSAIAPPYFWCDAISLSMISALSSAVRPQASRMSSKLLTSVAASLLRRRGELQESLGRLLGGVAGQPEVGVDLRERRADLLQRLDVPAGHRVDRLAGPLRLVRDAPVSAVNWAVDVVELDSPSSRSRRRRRGRRARLHGAVAMPFDIRSPSVSPALSPALTASTWSCLSSRSARKKTSAIFRPRQAPRGRRTRGERASA